MLKFIISTLNLPPLRFNHTLQIYSALFPIPLHLLSSKGHSTLSPTLRKLINLINFAHVFQVRLPSLLHCLFVYFLCFLNEFIGEVYLPLDSLVLFDSLCVPYPTTFQQFCPSRIGNCSRCHYK